MKKQGFLLGIFVILAALTITACGKGNAGAPDKSATGYNNEPVKLTLYDYQAGINENVLETYIIKPIQSKYPNITFELLRAQSPEEMAASGTVPDLVTTSNVYVNYLMDLGFGTDLQSIIKRSGFNFDLLEPEVANELRKFSSKGEIFGLPFSMNYGVMLYNLQLFDKFGLDYPKDGMTWNETLELGGKLTRTEGNIRYIGVSMGAPQPNVRQYSLPVVDEKQEKSVVNTDGFKKVFLLLRQQYEMNGFIGPNNEFSYGFNHFAKDQILAMNPNWIAAVTDPLMKLEQEGSTLNWNMVSYPTFDDRPNLGRQIDFHLFMVPPAAKNKDAAHEVMNTLLSKEMQSAMNKAGRMTVMKDANMRNQFAADTNVYNGKNLAGIFKVSPAPAPMSTIYDTQIYAYLQESNKDMALNNVDVNTALRNAEEKANKYIQEMKQKVK